MSDILGLGKKLRDSPLVMGILNVTPDSFFDGGRYTNLNDALRQTEAMIEAGADIIDVGGESTRPGAAPVTESEELARVMPVVEAIRQRFPIPLSVDTSTPSVMRAALTLGVEVINDVRALTREGALSACADGDGYIVLMHMQGTPATMQRDPRYADLFGEINQFFEDRISACAEAGINASRLILDPGFGFGKTLEHNFKLVDGVDQFLDHGLPLLMGLSRKRSIAETAGDVVAGSVAGHLLAVLAGASIVRVHDVGPMVSAIQVYKAIKGSSG